MNYCKFLFLGTGGSSGIPIIGCQCRVCTSTDSCNQRLRPSGLISCGNKKILIDSGPDFRLQALKYQINELDGVMLSHAHFDHIAGLDELRIYYLRTRKPLPVLVSEATFYDVKQRYPYLFKGRDQSVSLSAQLEFKVLEQKQGTIEFLDLKIRYIEYAQAGMPVIGYRLGSFAYITDIRNYPEEIFNELNGVKILVLSVLSHTPSHMHFSVEEGIEFAKKVGAEQTYFTHISHRLEHRETNARLPKDYQLAHDGLKLDFEYEGK